MKGMYEYQRFICTIVALNSNLYKVKHVTRAVGIWSFRPLTVSSPTVSSPNRFGLGLGDETVGVETVRGRNDHKSVQ